MNRRPLTFRNFVAFVSSERTWRELLREDSRASRYARLFLRAGALDAFGHEDLAAWRRRTVDRRLAQWRHAGILESAGRIRRTLPFNPRARKAAKERLPPGRRGHRRGRPQERYRIVDPYAHGPRLQPPPLPVAVALLRDPLAHQFLATLLKRWFLLMATREGRKFFEDNMVPLFDPELREPWRGVLDAFDHADPAFVASLPDQVEADVLARCRAVLPQLATLLETLAERSAKTREESTTAASPASPGREGREGETPSQSR